MQPRLRTRAQPGPGVAKGEIRRQVFLARVEQQRARARAPASRRTERDPAGTPPACSSTGRPPARDGRRTRPAMQSRRLSSCLRRAAGAWRNMVSAVHSCLSIRALFMTQQPALDLDQVAAARMGEAAQAVGGDDAMAGNHQRKIIRAAGLAHGARRGSQRAREIAIGPRFAAGNRGDQRPTRGAGIACPRASAAA